ncbi:hypothetical protein XU18_4634 [Perkinsela sp. CCAP 1560/4]|nr:hypothetical protein XU18_4634 [Perkinsela sp. CCAP 1560/4]|eukprot:KNH04066.1 hypothetical protein XU18_4634 [Perkinsela sp. CCAP 1560/4]
MCIRVERHVQIEQSVKCCSTKLHWKKRKKEQSMCKVPPQAHAKPMDLGNMVSAFVKLNALSFDDIHCRILIDILRWSTPRNEHLRHGLVRDGSVVEPSQWWVDSTELQSNQ